MRVARRGADVARIVVRCVAAIAVAVALGKIGFDLWQSQRWHALSSLATMPEPLEGAEPWSPDVPRRADVAVDWDALDEQGIDCAGWLTVGGTSINGPVAQAWADDPAFYLDHDAWGGWSEQGCPFLDCRSDPTAGAQLVFGHHFTYGPWSQVAFSELHDCWDQASFDLLTESSWTARGQHTAWLRPLCALIVDESDQEIQRMGFSSLEDLRGWLAGTVERSSAVSASAEEIVGSATRAVTLVTCSSDLPGQPERCVIVLAGAWEP